MEVSELGKNQSDNKVNANRRMIFIFCVFFILFFGLFSRLIYIMVVQSTMLKAAAVEEYTSEIPIYGKRGKILDRNGIELAVSFNVYRVDLDLRTIRSNIPNVKNLTDDQVNAKLDVVAKELADAAGMKFEDADKIVKQTLKSGLPPASVNLARGVEKSVSDKVAALKIYGVLISSDTKRYYPNNNFLAQVLGFTGSDGNGIYGVESIYNKVLEGSPGQKTMEMDRKTGEELPYSNPSYSEATDGKDVQLSIDFKIQLFAEKTAEQALKDNKAKSVSIIVSDPNNGEILAMVNKPDYNPNNPILPGKSSDELNEMWKNRAVNDTFEPGSIFKIVTAAAAMKEGLVQENDTFICNGGLLVGSSYIRCAETHNKENFVDIIANSCNVGFMELGKKLGKEKLNDYIKLFGFGQKTGIDLNGEATGIVKATDKISNVDLACLSFGQVDTVSCVQYIAAINAVANGGKWIRPHVMSEIAHVDSSNKKTVDETYNNFGTKQILDPDLMKTLRGYLEQVVIRGTAQSAFVDGLHIAGKTGTAQVAANGGYAKGKYVASFAGMAPADKPKYTVIVSVEEPDESKYYAGETAAPVAKQIFTDLFNYEDITPHAAAVAPSLK